MAILDIDNTAYNYQNNGYKYIDNNVLKRVVLYEFTWFDEILLKPVIKKICGRWLASKEGQWCEEHAHSIEYVSQQNVETMSHSIKIVGHMMEKDYIWFLLNK